MTNQEQMLNQIKEYAQAYYTGNALIEDDEFDALVDEYEAQYGAINKVGWGYEPQGDKISHKYCTVGSLHKTKSTEGIMFGNKILTDKLDGISCVAYYIDGVLEHAVTRGNGYVGVDITQKFLNVNHSVAKIEGFTGAVRGELVMSNLSWNEFSQKYDYENSRNAVAGIINGGEVDKDKLGFIDFVAYKILAYDNKYSQSATYEYTDILKILSYFGFKVVHHIVADELPKNQYPTSIDDMKRIYDHETIFDDKVHPENEYPRDGVVITDNEMPPREEGVFYYNDFAFKFASDTKDTVVTGISWNLTRTGRMVPTILVEPIHLAGVTVRRATGHNAKFIKDYHIGVGKKVRITRSGEVIPYIVAVHQEWDDGSKELQFISDLYKEEESKND